MSTDEFGITDEDRERIAMFNETNDGRSVKFLEHGEHSMKSELSRDDSYLVTVLIDHGHFPKFLAEELDVSEEVVEWHYENQPYDYCDAKVMTLAECHTLNQEYNGENVGELADEYGCVTDTVRYHVEGECRHDERVLEVDE